MLFWLSNEALHTSVLQALNAMGISATLQRERKHLVGQILEALEPQLEACRCAASVKACHCSCFSKIYPCRP